MKKNIINILIIFIVGGIAGVLFSDVLLPKLSNVGAFSSITWLKNLKDQTVIINKTEEVNINESEILGSIIGKNKLSEVIVKSFRNNNLISSGSGFIVSSDGLILTRIEVVSKSADRIVVSQGEEEFSAEVSKSLDDYGLVLLRSNASNLPVVSFADTASKTALGSKVVLMGSKKGSEGTIDFVNIGVLKSIDNSILETTIKEDVTHSSGTPLLDLKGNVLGINFTNSAGYVLSVSSDVIQSFLY